MSYVWKNFIVMWLLVFAGFTVVMCYRAFFTNPESLYIEEFITATESAQDGDAFLSRGDQQYFYHVIM